MKLSRLIILFTLLGASSCLAPFENGEIKVDFGNLRNKAGTTTNINVTSVSIVNDQLVVNGTDLSGVTGVRVTGPSGFDHSFVVESKTEASLIANGISNLAFAIDSIFNLTLTDANGAATFQITFTLQDGAVTASKLADMGASVGQVLKFDGTNWGPSDLGALTYAGNWNASTNTPNLSGGGNLGEYYIVNTAGASNLAGGPGTNSWLVGDWAVWNNVLSRWEKVDNATNVTSFNGRSGPVSPTTGDYTWAQINKATSALSDIANVEAPAGDGSDTNKVLKWNNATSTWELGDDLSGGGAGSVSSTEIADGAIVNADINAAAAIAQSKIANLTADLAAKEASITAAATTTYFRGDKTFVTLDTAVVTENTNLYFTDARAKTAAVLNTTAGVETDQAPSVAAMKTYVTANAGTGNFMADGSVAMTGNLNLGANNLVTSGTVDGVDVSSLNTTVSSLSTTAVSEGINLYFTDARAKAAAVLNTMAGTETDQAPSVAAMKTYITANAGTGDFMADGSVTMTGNLNLGANNLITSGTVDGVDVSALDTTVSANTTAISGKESAISAAATTTYFRGDKTFVTLSTAVVPEVTNLYFTDARAKAAAVVNTAAGSETDQAASVAAMKTYVLANSGGTGNLKADGSVAMTGDLDMGSRDIASVVDVTASGEISSATLATTGDAEVGGSLKVGNDVAACDGSKAGTFKYNNGFLYICDATDWKVVKLETPVSDLSVSPVAKSDMDLAGGVSPGSYDTFTITNDGSGDSTVMTTALSNTTNFEIGTDNCDSTTLAAGASCTIQVRAKTTTTGAYSSNLTVTADSVATSSLSGTGTGFSPVVCGGPGDSCYDDATAIADEVATTPLGVSLEYVIASGGFKVWRESGGSNRIMRASGLEADGWLKELNGNGNGLSVTDYTVIANLAGRVCPTKVYISDGDKFNTTACLYYDAGNASQALSAGGSDGITGMTSWSNYNGGSEKWMVGNIATCSNKGMRLPTLYETTGYSTHGNYPTADGAPGAITATNGLPNHSGYTWTASASSSHTSVYWTWSGTSDGDAGYGSSRSVRCVLP